MAKKMLNFGVKKHHAICDPKRGSNHKVEKPPMKRDSELLGVSQKWVMDKDFRKKVENLHDFAIALKKKSYK